MSAITHGQYSSALHGQYSPARIFSYFTFFAKAICFSIGVAANIITM
ncbi:Uncharacterised protein [Chlamydia trachomatis]|nr:Uncharacterised protein [Chlamydia trachomatis]